MDPRRLTRQNILDIIVESCDENKISSISNETIAERIGKSAGTVASHLTILEKEGTITRLQTPLRDEKTGRIKGTTRIIKVLKEQADVIPEKIWCTPGVNDIATTHPHIIHWLVNPEDGHKYSHGSEKKVKVKCEACGYEQEKMVCELCNSGFNCPICGGKISYPNKYIRAFLSQLPINNLIPEYKDNWTNNKVYDNYFEYNNQKYLVEVDGSQHNRNTQWSSLEDQQKNDELKNQLAEENGYHLIRLSCGRSRDYKIKETILDSEFNNIFDLSKIDWAECSKKAAMNLTYEICNYLNENPLAFNKEIAEHFHVGIDTVTDRIKKGNELGLLKDYDAEKRRIALSVLARERSKYEHSFS
jgi:DNA-binding MarR family transcriptional regulator